MDILNVSMLLNVWVLGIVLVFIYSLYVNHGKVEGEKSSLMNMILGSVLWPFHFIYKIFHKLVG